jgi:hypothetical protein
MSLKCTLLGADGGDPFPCFSNIWSVYAKKGLRTVFLSIGNSKSCVADLELAETIGCAIHVVPLTPTAINEWEEVRGILKTHERPSDAISDFSKGAENKWVLQKNLHIHSTLPWWVSSTMDLSGTTLKTEPFFSWVEKVCAISKVVDNTRLDILKIDVTDGLECSLLGAMLDAGFRPGCIIINWAYMPDTHTPTTLAAGNLQNCGYKLMAKEDKKFFYYFVDQDMYMTCSWECTKYANPMVYEIISDYKNAMASRDSANGPNATNKSFTDKSEADTAETTNNADTNNAGTS